MVKINGYSGVFYFDFAENCTLFLLWFPHTLSSLLDWWHYDVQVTVHRIIPPRVSSVVEL